MKVHLKSLALPLLVAAYPVLFLFGQNASALQPDSLNLPLGATLLATTAAYLIFLLIQRKPASASLSAVAFALAYYGYGYLYHYLIKLDWFPVYHFMLLPVVFVAVGYAGYGLFYLKPEVTRALQNILLVTAAVLVTYNVAVTVPVEVNAVKASPIEPKEAPTPAAAAVLGNSTRHPDIYYIVFDEYAGFDAIRQYWHMTYVDDFQDFLENNHFFVANGSRSHTVSTINEVTSRLNLHAYPDGTSSDILVPALNDNLVMQVVKSYGYTTVAINMAFSGIQADVNIPFKTQSVSGMASSEFRQTFMDGTMLSALSSRLNNNNLTAIKQRDMIMYALKSTVDQQDTPSPKFVYTHILLPHMPFIFDKDGNLLPPQAGDDWHYYQGQHQYATQLAQQLITELLAQADPANPPVIILQSDHGARNLQRRTKDNIIMNGYLEDYPGKFNQYILNALYLPGYDYTLLSDSMDPLDTFVLVLNHYLNANVAIH